MSVVRRFLVAPSLVRLLRKERGGSRVTEGYFAPQAGRTSFVRVQGTNCFLVLMTGAEGAMAEERTEVPRAHGDALLDVCAGRAVYERTTVSLGAGGEALIDRYVRPAGLDIVSLVFPEAGAAQAFTPPVWFGAEVTTDKAYDGQSIALTGIPSPGDIPLSNAALDAVLDLIEPRFGSGRPPLAPPLKPRDSAPPPRAPEPPKAAPETLPMASAAEAATPAEPKAEEQPQPSEEPPPAEASVAPVQAEASQEAAPEAVQAEEPAQTESPAEEPRTADAPQEPQQEPHAPAHAADASAVPAESQERLPPDARIDDVIESLSKALGAAIRNPQEPGRDEEVTEAFERWQVRPRRTQQT